MATLEEIQAFKEKAKASGRDDLVARADAKIAQMTAQQPQQEGYVEAGVAPAPKPEISPVDYLIGLGEIGRMMASGTFQGMPAGVGTFIGQAAGAMKQGEFGEPQAARNIMESTASAMGEATYAPKTEAAQQMLKGLEPLSQLPITLGMGGAPAAIMAQSSRAVAPVVAGKASQLVDKTKPATQMANDVPVDSSVERVVEAVTPDGASEPTVTQTVSAEAVVPDTPEVADLKVKAKDDVYVGRLFGKAEGTGSAAIDARKELADLIDVDKDLMKKADDLGYDLPIDIYSNNTRLKDTIVLMRAQICGEESAEWQKSLKT